MHNVVVALFIILFGASAAAQQTGRIEGTVALRGAGSAAGIAVSADADVMPRVRTTASDPQGRFALPKLPPGSYRVTFTDASGAARTIATKVLLDQTTVLAVELDAPHESEIEELVVVGQRIALRGRAALANALDGDLVGSVPLGRDYRDLVKLAPGVQYTEDAVRGPSAGGNGQDNVYRFDGVDVSLPMFGTLSAEPSTHDIEQVTFERGGVAAIGFNRSGGFTMDSTAKSGTDEFAARIEFTAAPKSLVAESTSAEESAATHQTDANWTTIAVGGPLVPTQLFAYGSYYRPAETRANKATAYGPAKDYSNIREEYYANSVTHRWMPLCSTPATGPQGAMRTGCPSARTKQTPFPSAVVRSRTSSASKGRG